MPWLDTWWLNSRWLNQTTSTPPPWSPDIVYLDGEYRGGALDTVWSRNQHREYVRQRKHPAQPHTGPQNSAQANLAAAVAAWTALTEAQRAAWREIEHLHPLRSVFGNPLRRDGRNLYVAKNLVRLTAGLSTLGEPPATFLTVAPRSATVTIAPTLDSIICTLTAPITPAGISLNIWATPTLNAARTFWRWQARLVAINLTSPTAPNDIYTTWNARFGPLYSARNLGIGFQLLHAASGTLSKILKLTTPIP
jgi:hypothetical protein